MTREELQKTYADLSTQDLLGIVDRKFDYTELAVAVALEEISKRNISEEDIKNYKADQIENAKQFINRNIVDDLTIFQKNLFYFIWIPIVNSAFKQNFRDDGFILKLKQANYYSWFGFIFFMGLALLSGLYNLSMLTTLAFWILGFLVTYTFDEYFNRRRQIAKLKKMFERPSDEEDLN